MSSEGGDNFPESVRSLSEIMYLSIGQAIGSLHQDGHFHDLKVVVDGKEFQCHRLVLASISDFFKSSLTSQWLESSSGVVNIDHEDVPAEMFMLLMDILYDQCDAVTMENAQDVLKMAIYLQIKILEEHCETYLSDHLTPQTCVGVWMFAKKYQLNFLAETARIMAVNNLPDVSQHEEILQLPKAMLLVLLSDYAKQDLMVPENEPCHTIIRWLEGDLEARKVHAGELVPFVNFCQLTPKYLKSLLRYLDHPLREYLSYNITEALQYNLESSDEEEEGEKQDEEEGENTRFHAAGEFRCTELKGRLAILARQDARVVSPKLERCVVSLASGSPGEIFLSPTGTSVCCFELAPSNDILKSYTLSTSPQILGDNFATCKWRNEIYVSGGSATPSAVRKYSPGSKRWEVLPTMAPGRAKHTMEAVNWNLFVLGGCCSGDSPHMASVAASGSTEETAPSRSQLVSEVMKFDIRTESWERFTDLKLAVQDATSAVVGHRIYVFGGVDMEGNAVDTVQCVDTITGGVYLAGHLPSPTCGARAVSDGGTIYVITNVGRVLKMAENFDLADMHEQRISEPQTTHRKRKRTADPDCVSDTVRFTWWATFPKRKHFGAFIEGASLYICGGREETGYQLSGIIRVDLDTDDCTWLMKRTMPTGHSAAFGPHVMHFPLQHLASATSSVQPFKIGDRVKTTKPIAVNVAAPGRAHIEFGQAGFGQSRFGQSLPFGATPARAVELDSIGTIQDVRAAEGIVIVDFPQSKGQSLRMDSIKYASFEERINPG